MGANIVEVIENSKEKCVGCSACLNVCPKEAIIMKKNEEGFLYPSIDEKKCIKCNMCKKICPALNNPIKEETSDVYAYCSNDNKNWLSSTSGGAFTDICNIWEKKHPDSLYYGATINDNNEVKHIGVEIAQLDKIKKSKYVQSELGIVFKQIKKKLEEGKNVMFSGTPCQVAAINTFLKKKYDNLLLIDVVCHGVGSGDVFKKCLEYEEKKLGQEIKKYTFRYKKNINFKVSKRYNVEYILKDGKRLVNNSDSYIQIFLNGSCLRNSCSNNCKFKASNSYSDITLADLNSKSKIIPSIYDKRNYSAIFFHTEKKEQFIERLKEYGIMVKCNKNDVVKYNKVYKSNNDCKEKRTIFFNNYLSSGENISKILDEEKSNQKKINLDDQVPYFIKYIINNCKEKIFNGRK